MRIDRVGVKDFRLPLVVSDRRQGRQHTVARVDLGVELPAQFKGTHMSRFIEALDGWSEELSYQSIKNLLKDVKSRLKASKAYAVFRFTYFITKKAPVSGAESLIGYKCCLTGEMRAGAEGPHFRLEVEVPVTRHGFFPDRLVVSARFLAEDQSYGPVGVRAGFGVLDKVPTGIVFTPDTFWPVRP